MLNLNNSTRQTFTKFWVQWVSQSSELAKSLQSWSLLLEEARQTTHKISKKIKMACCLDDPSIPWRKIKQESKIGCL